jgi:hypothetical protein
MAMTPHYSRSADTTANDRTSLSSLTRMVSHANAGRTTFAEPLSGYWVEIIAHGKSA